MTIRWRLTLFHTLTILLVGSLLVTLLFIVLFRSITAHVDSMTRGRAIEAAWLIEGGASIDDPRVIRLSDNGVYLVIRDPSGAVLRTYGTPTFRIDLISAADRTAFWEEAAGSAGVQRYEKVSGLELLGVAVALPGGRGGVGVIESWKSYDTTVDSFVPFLPAVTFILPSTLLLAVLGSYVMARVALSPVDAIVRAARRISERDLSQRLPVRHRKDELGRLATTFNGVLDRLDGAFRQRQRSLDEQRRFVADASHELRTPLTSIAGYARMLREWAHDDPATARESAAAIEREAARMAGLVEDLLLLARGDEAMVDACERSRQDLVGVVDDAVEAARIVAAGRVPILFPRPPEPIMVTIDRRQIHQVVTILLDNAVKYTPADGERPVTVTIRSMHGQVAIDVADSGPGIPPEHLPRIFERFYRGDAARSGDGTGLGLPIARQLVARHGGTITVTSQEGVGALFTVTLPLTGRVADGDGRERVRSAL